MKALILLLLSTTTNVVVCKKNGKKEKNILHGVSLDEKVIIDKKKASIQSGFCTEDREFSECIPWGVKKVLQNELKFFNNLKDPIATMKVCIVSTGYYLGHDDLPLDGIFGVIGMNSRKYGSWKEDVNGTGTAHAGVIAALDNTKGIIGVIPNNKGKKFQLAVVKGAADDGTTTSNEMLSAIDKCIELGSKVISIPFIFDRDERKMVSVLKEFYEEKGVLMFAGAGTGGFPDYKYPASLPEVISVVPSDENDNVFSGNYNDQVELTAPGFEILTTMNDQDTWAYWTGSGMAADFAAGVAGLVWMYFPECTNFEIRSILQESALDLSTPGYDKFSGHGLVQAKAAYDILKKCGCSGNCGKTTPPTPIPTFTESYTFPPTRPENIFPCSVIQHSGGQGLQSYYVELGKTRGRFDLSYDMYVIPDKLTISYEGKDIFSTKDHVSGSKAMKVRFGKKKSKRTMVKVDIEASNSGTAWEVMIDCPK